MTHPEIEEWLATAEGVKMNPDGRYGLQCVDAIDEFAQCLTGTPWPQSVGGVQGAKQLLDVAPDKYWLRFDNNPNDPNHLPERGDWLVYGGDGSNTWGHVCATLAARVSGATVGQQDGFAEPRQFVDGAWYSAKPFHVAELGWGQRGTGPLLGWLRLRPENIRDTGAAARLAPAKASQCVVEAGDSLSLIAIQFGTTLDALRTANPGVSDLIHPGQVLNLP